MSKPTKTTANSVKAYCAKIGEDPLLVQGAGGNVSWKDGDILWIKASGTWLARAQQENIFIPVDLAHLRTEIGRGNYSVTPEVSGNSTLRPSIETLMHALMPQTIVVHLHAVEALAHLAHENFGIETVLLPEDVAPWAVVEYFKPGAELAREVQAALDITPSAKVIFLRNHGIVIGAEDVDGVDKLLTALTRALRTDITSPVGSMLAPSASLNDQYFPLADIQVQQLALNPDYFKRLSSDWALYPDHVVFLGSKAYACQTWDALDRRDSDELPELVFIGGKGVYAKSSFNTAKQLQLRCYFDIIARQKPDTKLRSLTSNQISELLNWDAEHYRMNISVKP